MNISFYPFLLRATQYLFGLALLFVLSFSADLQAQEVQPPASGKAVVYFVRPYGLGTAVNFRFYHQDQYIGKFNGNKYMRYEIEPGEHLFWAKSENREFITIEAEADKIYMVDVKVKMGGMKARVGLEPVDYNDEKLMEKIDKLLAKKGPEEFDSSALAEGNEKYADEIEKTLTQYEEEFKQEREIHHIKKDQYYRK